MARRYLAGVLVLILLAAAWGALARSGSWAAAGGDYDLIRLLRQLEQANGEIHQANGEILAVLAQVGRDAQRSAAVHRRMQALEAGLHQQQASLERLLGLTRAQARLSLELKALTGQIEPHGRSLAQTAATEAVALEQMAATTARLAGRLAEIEAANQRVAAKLARAEALSALVLSRMP